MGYNNPLIEALATEQNREIVIKAIAILATIRKIRIDMLKTGFVEVSKLGEIDTLIFEIGKILKIPYNSVKGSLEYN